VKSDDESVRQAALHGISRWRDHGATDLLLDVLKKGDAPQIAAPLPKPLAALTRRSARKQDDRKETNPQQQTVIAALVDALAQPNDHTLHHSLTYALLEIDVAPTLLDNLKNNIRRSAVRC